MPHIPAGESSGTELLSFEKALALSGSSGGYDPARWIYVPDFYTEYRYILGTRGENPLICIGINPSTAAPDALDNTLKSVSRIAQANRYDSFIMFNVYAQRATDPDQMDKVFIRIRWTKFLTDDSTKKICGRLPMCCPMWGRA